MKKIVLAICVGFSLVLTGCLETVQEINLNDDGSGTISSTQEMGALLGLIGQMGGSAEMEKAGLKALDTSFSLKGKADSIPGLSPVELNMINSGIMKMSIDMKEQKFSTNLSCSFTSPAQIASFNKVSGKLFNETMKKQLDGGMKDVPPGLDQLPEMSSIEDYYELEFSEGELKRKVIKSKYENVEKDEYLKGMKQASSMGITVKTTYVFNLPRPASKVEGKNLILSEDKKKVTLTASLDDFFENAEALEFKIKY